jgi:hypothetical protein
MRRCRRRGLGCLGCDGGQAVGQEKNERWLLFAPTLSAALSLSYDVGFFWSVDIHLFTLFSLSEHLVFAMQALPVASIIAVICAFAISIHYRATRTSPASKLIKLAARYDWFINVMYAVFGLLFLIVLFLKLYETAIISGAFVIVAVSVDLLRRANITIRLEIPTTAVTLLLAFVIGSSSADFYLDQNVARQKITIRDVSVPIEANVIRAGDRGLLVFMPATNEIAFFRMNDVISVRELRMLRR